MVFLDPVRSRLNLYLSAIVLVVCSSFALARVEVNVTHVGFPSVARGDVIRAGSWVPVVVDVVLANDASFDGVIRLAQPDGDGDECYDSAELHLRAESGGVRRLFLYALANPLRNRDRFHVEVRGADGEAVEVVSQGVLTYIAGTAAPAETVAEDDLLVLSVSNAAVGRISSLMEDGARESFHQAIHVAHLGPSDLPELWLGLDAVDYIVWDEANPDDLTPRQVEALVEWTRNGGTLFIAASRTAAALKLNKVLEPILPVDLGDVVSVESLPEFRLAMLDPPRSDAEAEKVVNKGWELVPFDTPVPMVARTPRADALWIRSDSSFASDIITRRRLGQGHVIFSAIALRDLFGLPGGVRKFFTRVFQLRGLDNPDGSKAMPRSLQPSVVSAVGFSTSGSFYLLMAALFSISYMLAATFGTWKALGLRGWRHHSWSAFALVAIAASFLSLVGVGWMRGLVDRVHQIAIIDADAGNAQANATAFFGFKTALDKEVDLWLPSDWAGATEPTASNCFLRPLPEGNDPDEAERSFADPEEYRLVPTAAMIDDVRIRATLKRFEGRWQGPLGGKLTGQITVRGREITPDSYIVNELGVDLEDCYLIQPALNTDTVAGGRDQGIYAYPLGSIPSGLAKVLLHPRCYATQGNETINDVMIRSQLEDAHVAWTARFKGILDVFSSSMRGDRSFTVGAEKDALLLLSTLGEFDTDSMGIPAQTWGMSGMPTWSRDRMRRLDLRTQLHAGRVSPPPAEPGAVVLIGFAAGPGPIRLFSRSGERDFRPLQPESPESWCMYRIRIPTTPLAAAPEKQVDPIDEVLRRKP